MLIDQAGEGRNRKQRRRFHISHVSVASFFKEKSKKSQRNIKEISKKGIIGMDIMEVCPSFDVKDRTSHLASRIISEVIYSSGGT